MTARRVTALAMLALLIVGTVIALSRAADTGSGDPVRQVAAQLSCPDCAGQSVADSNSPVAESMRTVIAAQITQGHTPQQVRDWFVDRYGEDVLRTPRSAADPVLWAGPLAVAVTAGIAAAYTIGRRRTDTPTTGNAMASRRPVILVSVTGVVVAMVVAVGVAGRWIERPASTTESAATVASAEQSLGLARSLENQGSFAAAADQYREAAAMRPDPVIRLRLAFALLRANKPYEALPIAESVQAQSPADPDALLILGLAQHAVAKPDAVQTLSQFLKVAPDHPAAAEVRGLISH